MNRTPLHLTALRYAERIQPKHPLWSKLLCWIAWGNWQCRIRHAELGGFCFRCTEDVPRRRA